MANPPVHWTSLHAAIVDLDGTMVDTVGDFEVALRRAFGDLGLAAVERSFICRTVGKGTEHLLTRALAATGAPEALFDQVLQRYEHHYLAINGEHSAVFPGVIEGLQQLRQAGFRLACVTNKPTAFTLPLLARKGLDGFFDAVFGGDAFERKKPDPLPLLKSCEALGCTPERTLVIGDSSNDAQAARAAGCPVVLVSYGYNHGEPVAAAMPDAIVERIDELPRRFSLAAG